MSSPSPYSPTSTHSHRRTSSISSTGSTSTSAYGTKDIALKHQTAFLESYHSHSPTHTAHHPVGGEWVFNGDRNRWEFIKGRKRSVNDQLRREARALAERERERMLVESVLTGEQPWGR